MGSFAEGASTGTGWVEAVCRGDFGPPEIQHAFNGREDAAPLWALLTAIKLRLNRDSVENPAIGPYALIAALKQLGMTSEPIPAATSIQRKADGSQFAATWDIRAAASDQMARVSPDSEDIEMTTLVWIPHMSRYVDVCIGKLAELKTLESKDNRFTQTAVLPGANSPERLQLNMRAHSCGQSPLTNPLIMMPRGPFAVTWTLLIGEPGREQKGPPISPGGPLAAAVQNLGIALAHDTIALLRCVMRMRNLQAIETRYRVIGDILHGRRLLNGPTAPGEETLKVLGMKQWPTPSGLGQAGPSSHVQFGLRQSVFGSRRTANPRSSLPFERAIRNRCLTVASPECGLHKFDAVDLPCVAATLAWQLSTPHGQASSLDACVHIAAALNLLGVLAEPIPVGLTFTRGSEVIHYGCLDPGWTLAHGFEGHLVIGVREGNRYLDPLAPDLPVLNTVPFAQALLCGPLTEDEWNDRWSRPVGATLRAHYRRVAPEYEQSWRAGLPAEDPARAHRLAAHAIELLQWDQQLDRIGEADYPLLATLRPMLRGRRMIANRPEPTFEINDVEVPWRQIHGQAIALLPQ